jgi:hypothetical protein
MQDNLPISQGKLKKEEGLLTYVPVSPRLKLHISLFLLDRGHAQYLRNGRRDHPAVTRSESLEESNRLLTYMPFLSGLKPYGSPFRAD